MSYVVTVLSWAGWIWTAAFFAVVVPLLRRDARRRREAAGQGFEVLPAATVLARADDEDDNG